MDSRVILLLIFAVVSSWAAAIDDLEREIDEERGFRDAMRKVGDGLKKAAPYAKKLIPAVYDALKTREEVEEKERFIFETANSLFDHFHKTVKNVASAAKDTFTSVLGRELNDETRMIHWAKYGKELPKYKLAVMKRETSDETRDFTNFKGFLRNRLAVMRPLIQPSVIRPSIQIKPAVLKREIEDEEERGLIETAKTLLEKLHSTAQSAASAVQSKLKEKLTALLSRELNEEEERGIKETMKRLGKKALPYAKKLLPVLVDQLRTREEETSDETRGFTNFKGFGRNRLAVMRPLIQIQPAVIRPSIQIKPAVLKREIEDEEERGLIETAKKALEKLRATAKSAASAVKSKLKEKLTALLSRELNEEEERGFRETVKKLGKKALPIAKKLLPVLVDQLRTREEIEEQERGLKSAIDKTVVFAKNAKAIGVLPALKYLVG